jgi:hypothetical protein
VLSSMMAMRWRWRCDRTAFHTGPASVELGGAPGTCAIDLMDKEALVVGDGIRLTL